MNRRSLLSILGGAAAGLIADPDLAKWVPGRKVVSIPRPFEPLSLFESFEYPAYEVMMNPAALDAYVSLAADSLRRKVDSFGLKHGVFIAPRDPRRRGVRSGDVWKRHGVIPRVGGLANVRLMTVSDLCNDQPSVFGVVRDSSRYGRLDIILAPRG